MAVIDAAIAVGTFVGADALGAGAAAAAGGALMGAGAGALYSGITGDGNILNSALNGALIGGTLGFGGEALGLGSAASAAPTAATGVGGALAPTGGAAVTGGLAPVAEGGVGLTSGAVDAALQTGLTTPAATVLPNVSAGYAFTPAEMAAGVGTPATSGLATGSAFTPAEIAAGQGTTTYGGLGVSGTTGANVPAGFTPGSLAPPPASGFWDSSMGTAAKWGAGLMAANALLGADNKKYGTFSQQQLNANNGLNYPSNFGTYQPLDTSVMRPMGAPVGYTGTPYGAPGYMGSRVGYAEGGIAAVNPLAPKLGPVEQMSRDNATGQNMMFPQAAITTPAFASPTNIPMGNNMIAPAGDVSVDPYTGAERFAEGGMAHYDGGGLLGNIALMPIRQLQAASNNPEQALIGANTPFETSMWNGLLGTNYTPTTNMWGTPTDQAVQSDISAHRPQYAAGGIAGHSSLGSYAAGGNPRLLKGPGDGMSDNIPAMIGGAQPARLADGEFVVPADVVSHLGNGSTDAGADKLHSMMDKVRKARTGTKKQGKQIKADKFIPK
jgi:hypothetical protein